MPLQTHIAEAGKANMFGNKLRLFNSMTHIALNEGRYTRKRPAPF